MRNRLFSGLVFCFAAWGQTAPIAVVNGASFQPGAATTPGSIASVFGQNLCPQTQYGSFVGPNQLPTQLAGCSVTVNGTAAMLFYVSPTQMKILIPSGAGTSDNAAVTVNNGTQVQSGSMMLSGAAPGIFSMRSTGMGMGAIINATTFQPGPFMMAPNSAGMSISLYVTGMDPSAQPSVTIGGAPAQVTFSGPAPGFVGLQQINVVVPAASIPAGRMPVSITSGGVTSNVTFLDVLPTARMMAEGMGPGMMGGNTGPVNVMSGMAVNPSKRSVLIGDDTASTVRVMSMTNGSALATISLPASSDPDGIAVNSDGTTGAVALSNRNSVELLDLGANTAIAEIPVGIYPRRLAFAGNMLLVTNMAGDTVSVVDWAGRKVVRDVPVGHGPEGIAVDTAHNRALIANMQSGNVTAMDLSTFATSNVPLGPNVRPSDIVVSGGNAVITAPTSNQVFIMDLGSMAVQALDTTDVVGPNAVSISGNTAYITGMLSSVVGMIDVAGRRMTGTVTVDPGPRAIGLDTTANRMMVLSQGAQALNVMNASSGTVTDRFSMP